MTLTDDSAIAADLLAGANPEPVADLHLLERHVRVGVVLADQVRGLRGEVQQGFDGTRRPLPRTELEDLTDNTSVVMTAAASKYTGTTPSIVRNESGKMPGGTVATKLNSQEDAARRQRPHQGCGPASKSASDT